MEGLLLAETLRKLDPLLPSERLAWRFLDAHTFVLPLAPGPALWLLNRPPRPSLELRDDLPASGRTYGGFQDQLLARASGPLIGASQHQLDRVVTFAFGASEGFVEDEPVTLVFELTGRNCNLVLVRDGIILGAARSVGSDINRFRQIQAGGRYQPPPPYHKLDPRIATEPELRQALEGLQLRQLRAAIDGIGPVLTRTLATMLEVSPETTLTGETLDQALVALSTLAAAPSKTVGATVGLPDLARLRERERREGKLGQARKLLTKEQKLFLKRLHDADRTIAAAQDAGRLRSHAELLMAYPQKVPANRSAVHLESFDGQPVEITLDPSLDAIGNAQRLYGLAKKRELRAAAAQERRVTLARQLEQLEALLGRLAEVSDEELDEVIGRFGAERSGGGAKRKQVGLRFRDPHGFEVLIGRNAKENDAITFRVARSRDVWLHAQGYTGSHVLIRADGREVPFDTVLFAAALAAGHSKAAQGDNIAVDYTLKKNVWRVKGMPPGAAHMSHQKTVYVTPMRRPPPDPDAMGR